MRAFLGLSLPEEARSSLTVLQHELAASGADVKWVEPQNLHVTLKFLDEISGAECSAVERLLKRIAHEESPFSLALEGVGAFPSLTAPRVVWVDLAPAEGREAVARLVQMIEHEGTTIPLRQEERSFAAHLTIGRVRSPRNRQALAQRLREVNWTPPPSWNVVAVTLYQSMLSSTGPRYSALAVVSLGREVRPQSTVDRP